ncbi:MAG: hypothetical protein JEZ07_07210 [Phycisphaerae bacterium]|nr:hypothetical protein [Phycisphaerae bacterium]
MTVNQKIHLKNHNSHKANSNKKNMSNIWPTDFCNHNIKWFPAETRLIGQIRANVDSFILPPAVVRKAAWRD